jgi:hypothetical protein
MLGISSMVQLQTESTHANVMKPDSSCSLLCISKLSESSSLDVASEPIVHLVVIWNEEANQSLVKQRSASVLKSRLLTSIVLTCSELQSTLDLNDKKNDEPALQAPVSNWKSNDLISFLMSKDLIVRSQNSNLSNLETIISRFLGMVSKSSLATMGVVGKRRQRSNGEEESIILFSKDNQTKISFQLLNEHEAKLYIHTNSEKQLENMLWNISKQFGEDVTFLLDSLSQTAQHNLSSVIDCFLGELEFHFDSASSFSSSNQSAFIHSSFLLQLDTDSKMVSLFSKVIN